MDTSLQSNENRTLISIQTTLKITFGIVPIVAGLDKFTNLLTHWSNYLNPSLANSLPMSADSFMKIIGVVEIIAGIIVLWKPKIGAWIVMAWLILIALTLLLSGHYLDVAVRDLVMAIGALTLARLTAIIESYKTA